MLVGGVRPVLLGPAGQLLPPLRLFSVPSLALGVGCPPCGDLGERLLRPGDRRRSLVGGRHAVALRWLGMLSGVGCGDLSHVGHVGLQQRAFRVARGSVGAVILVQLRFVGYLAVRVLRGLLGAVRGQPLRRGRPVVGVVQVHPDGP